MARILLVNKFYYFRGGDCTAVLTTEELLKKHGHEVAVFSMRYAENLPTAWEEYFPEEVSFSQASLTQKVKALKRVFSDTQVVKKFNRLLSDFQPDIVHLHNIHSYLSPVIAQTAHQRGIRVVWTMHDYKLICPTYLCLRDNKPCELCFKNKAHVFRVRCMKNSRAASLLAWMEAVYWNRTKLERITDRFISPSSFLKEKMVAAGYQDKQIEVLHNFMYKQVTSCYDKEDYYCYAGRLSTEKGVSILLEAAKELPYPLKVIGGGPLLEDFRKTYPSDHIEFLGYLPQEKLFPLIQQARFSVIPSLCYENNPYGAIESLCLGTPVLGATIGGIPELIKVGINGDLFPPGGIKELRAKILDCFEHFTEDYPFEKIAIDAQNKFSSETFYVKLMKIYGY